MHDEIVLPISNITPKYCSLYLGWNWQDHTWRLPYDSYEQTFQTRLNVRPVEVDSYLHTSLINPASSFHSSLVLAPPFISFTTLYLCVVLSLYGAKCRAIVQAIFFFISSEKIIWKTICYVPIKILVTNFFWIKHAVYKNSTIN